MTIISEQFSKESEKLERSYIPPDYSSVGQEEDDDDDLDLDDDDDYYDEEEEEDDPAESEKTLEETSSKEKETIKDTQQQTNMATPGWPSSGGWPGSNSAPSNPWGGGGQSPMPWKTPGSSGFGGGWPGSGNSTPGTGFGNNNTIQSLDRNKRVIICDVLDCLICTLEGPQKLGLIPRDIWDIQLRLDVWYSMRRFSYLERVCAVIPKTLILNSSGDSNWRILLDYVACSLATFLRIPTEAVQILTQSFISQSKEDMIRAVTTGVPREDIVYIGTQSGLPGQNSSDADCAKILEIDYIDLQRFLTLYS